MDRLTGWDSLVSTILRGKEEGRDQVIQERGPRERPHHDMVDSIRNLRQGGITAIIGEIKPRSPSAGVLRQGIRIGPLIDEFQSADVAGISILTESSLFGGSRRMLLEASRRASVPLLRKDFLVEKEELEESWALGADAVLLIVRLLGSRLGLMYDAALELGLAPLVEVHNEGEMEVASSLDPDLVGINNRDLDDFTIDLGTTARLSPFAPKGSLVVSESGYACREDVLRMAPFCHAFLIGSALMARNPRQKLLELQGRED